MFTIFGVDVTSDHLRGGAIALVIFGCMLLWERYRLRRFYRRSLEEYNTYFPHRPLTIDQYKHWIKTGEYLHLEER